MGAHILRKPLDRRSSCAAMLAVGVALMNLGSCVSALAADPPGAATGVLGPTEWPQYRGTATRNAVFVTETRKNGAVASAFVVGAPIAATPVISGGRLYIGSMTGPVSGALHAFDVATGRELWQAKIPNWTMTDMVAVNGTLYVGLGNRSFATSKIRGAGDNGLMAVAAGSGQILWTFKTAGEVMPTPAVNHGVAYIATGDGTLYAVDARSGMLDWTVRLPGFDSMSSPALDRQHLYVGAAQSLVAVDLVRRAVTWTFKDNASFTDASPAVGPDAAGRRLIIITGVKSIDHLTREELATYAINPQLSETQFIYAFDQNGVLAWKDMLGQGPPQENNTSGAPTIADGKVFVGSPYTRAVHAYDLASGSELWRAEANAGVKGAPAVTGGRVYFGDVSGWLHVLDEASGREITRVQLGDKPLAPAGPVIVDDVLFVASQNGTVYARRLIELSGPQ